VKSSGPIDSPTLVQILSPIARTLVPEYSISSLSLLIDFTASRLPDSGTHRRRYHPSARENGCFSASKTESAHDFFRIKSDAVTWMVYPSFYLNKIYLFLDISLKDPSNQ